jgi:hypothetical protein
MRIRPMFRTTLAAVLATASLLAAPAGAQLKVPRPSPNAVVKQTVGITEFTVTYSRPGVKGRVIWGGLVPYDKPWRTGANEATTFTTTDEIQFGGKTLAAGTYSLLTIPGKDEWAVVLNAEKDLWGAFEYKPEKDVLSFKVAPVAAEAHEWMEFAFEDLTPTSANLVLRWEKLRLAIPIAVDVNPMVLANARTALAAAKPDDWRTPYQAANFCFNNDVAMDEGRKWLDRSLAVDKTFQNLTLLAKWQMKAGQRKDAIATAEKAISAGKASKDRIDTEPTEKLLAEWKAGK